jgi:hypothetical protein
MQSDYYLLRGINLHVGHCIKYQSCAGRVQLQEGGDVEQSILRNSKLAWLKSSF